MNQLRTVLLLGILSALLIGIGGVLGPKFLFGFTVLAVAMNIGSFFFSDRIVLAMHGAQEIGTHEAPGLHRIVEGLAAAAGIPKPRLFVMQDEQPNAFATGRNPEHGVVAVTTGILNTLNERELRGVLAHEIAHIRNRDILVASVAACIAAAVTYVANAGHFLTIFGGGQSGDSREGGSWSQSLLLVLLAPIAATLIQLGISRSREYMADASGARLTRDPEGLARALEGIHEAAQSPYAAPSQANPAAASLFIMNPFAGGQALLRLFSTHPPVEERVRRLRALNVV